MGWGILKSGKIMTSPDIRWKQRFDNFIRAFGSLESAMGRYREGSDIALALITGPFNHSDLLRLSQKIDDLMLPYKVDLVAIHEIDNLALLDHINRVGIDFLP